MVDVCAQEDRADRAHQETRAEGGEREHQRDEVTAVGEERGGDGGGVVAEDLEIVHLQRVARSLRAESAESRLPRAPLSTGVER